MSNARLGISTVRRPLSEPSFPVRSVRSVNWPFEPSPDGFLRLSRYSPCVFCISLGARCSPGHADPPAARPPRRRSTCRDVPRRRSPPRSALAHFASTPVSLDCPGAWDASRSTRRSSSSPRLMCPVRFRARCPLTPRR